MSHKLNLNSGHVFFFKAHEIGLVDSLNSTTCFLFYDLVVSSESANPKKYLKTAAPQRISNKIQQCRWVASDHQTWLEIHQLPSGND